MGDRLLSLFVTNLNLAVAAGWLIAALLLLRPLLKKIAPKWVLCAAWALVAVRLACPVALHSDLSAYRLAGDAVQPSGQVTYFQDTGFCGDVSYHPAALLPSVPAAQSAPTGGAAVSAAGTADTSAQRGTPVRFMDMTLPSVIWALGVGVMAVLALVGYVSLGETVAASAPLGGNVYVCDEIRSPFILGLFRPRIYLTSGMDETARACVLRHEQAHLRRWDHVWKPLGYALLAVYWYHPLMWVAYVLFCRDMELACDERVIRGMAAGERAAYSQTLLDCSQGRRWVAACPLAFGEVGVKTRIKAVLRHKKPALWAVLAAVVVCAVLAVCFLTDPKGAAEPEGSGTTQTDPDLLALAEQADGVDTVTFTWYDVGREFFDDTVPGHLLAQLLRDSGWTYRDGDAPKGSGDNRYTVLRVDMDGDTVLRFCRFYPDELEDSVEVTTGGVTRWYAMGDMTWLDVKHVLGPDREYLGEAGQTKEVVTFGHYEMDDDRSNGPEAIPWLVLAREGNRVLLISDYSLDYQSFTPTYQSYEGVPSWETSSLRTWLNTDFCSAAFTEEEQRCLVADPDPVFLLSGDEVRRYFVSEADTENRPTLYADTVNVESGYMNVDAGWLLRSMYDGGGHPEQVCAWGGVRIGPRSYEPAYIRPAIWVDTSLYPLSKAS